MYLRATESIQNKFLTSSRWCCVRVCAWASMGEQANEVKEKENEGGGKRK